MDKNGTLKISTRKKQKRQIKTDSYIGLSYEI